MWICCPFRGLGPGI
uniref:Uncharacterized protein n=1 Tax=Rhizophora mucronata TaxID=61149 RepID=A0A2P2QFP2_RHIMU